MTLTPRSLCALSYVRALALALCALVLSVQAQAQSAAPKFSPIAPLTAEQEVLYGIKGVSVFNKRPQPPTVSAKSWVVLDLSSYQVLASHNANSAIAPGALVQLMSAYVVLNEIKAKRLAPDASVPASVLSALGTFPSSVPTLHLNAQSVVTPSELLEAVAQSNAYDAAQALAILAAGSEAKFVDMMNRQAQSLNLPDTRFANATGMLDNAQRTTVSDMAWLLSVLREHFPEHYAHYAVKESVYQNIPRLNRNSLLWLDPSVDGAGVGIARGKDANLIASASRGARHVLSVVASPASDKALTQDAQALLNFGFTAFDAVRMFQADQPVLTLDTWKGASGTVRVGFTQDFVLSVPRDTAKAFKLEFAGKTPLVAPIAKGQTVGALKLMLGDELYAAYPVVALDNVPVAGWFGRTWDTLRWWIKK